VHGNIIRAYKYHAREEFELALADWLSNAVQGASWFDRVEAVVPVPTHWWRRLRRPLYPAEALGKLVSTRTRLPSVGLLRRVRCGPHQIGLSYTERQHNVHGAFAARRGVELHRARLLLIDDVKTTGATLNECARVLKRAGASEVYAAVIVKVDWRAAAGGRIYSA
jgi:ComF family protein